MGQPCGRSTWCPSVVFSQTALGCSLPSVHVCIYHRGAVAKQCPFSQSGLEGHFRLFVSVHWISSLNCIKHIYLPDPTHCERRDHTELSATAAVCRIEKAHPYLFLWPKISWCQSYNNTLPSIYIRHCCDICLYLHRTNGEWDLKWKWSIKHCNFLHPNSFPGRMRNRVPVKYFGCKLFWCMLQWTAVTEVTLMFLLHGYQMYCYEIWV